MEELIALLVLGGLSILFDRLNKKRSKALPDGTIDIEEPEDEGPLPSIFEEILTEKEWIIDEEPELYSESAPVEIEQELSTRRIKEPTAYDVSRLKQRKIISYSLKGNSIKKAIVLKEILDKPRGLDPYF